MKRENIYIQRATRRPIRVNRMTTAWLIRRFIDPQAVFVFVELDQVADIQQREGTIRLLLQERSIFSVGAARAETQGQ